MNFRHVISILLTFALALTVAACDKKAEEKKDDKAAAEKPAEATADKTPKGVCEYVDTFMPKEKQEGCLEALEEMKGQVPEEAWNGFAVCALAAKAEADLDPCMGPLIEAMMAKAMQEGGMDPAADPTTDPAADPTAVPADPAADPTAAPADPAAAPTE